MDSASPRRRASIARHLSLEPSPSASRRLSHGSIDTLEASGHQRKRRRTSHSEGQENARPDAVDLTATEDMDPVSRIQAKQRADVILAQQSLDHNKGESVLLAYKCPVCMDTPVDATSTACGHLFCHKCIIDTLKFSEEQRSDMSGKGPRGTCPVCRKYLSRNDMPGPKRNLVPLQIKLTTRKRRETEQ
ncbi:SUMO-targeted ubiquitin ligase complex subunit slx8 [Aspergillus brasiliensis]|uniref:RING-type domain-containing protein n=1 Tax=Aspergillus brasiliensis (strain CBS 101740 / IMI 381727 / IBT 21946) TaxID=767769 RepID=A0A1L9V0N3_ASPBC|nr:hypothetical protein ASPBRDRAFT_236205 [Aspergillus brasiliensis CBS 101740]GKZ34666.1 SUMO-targeted ubiquitin ligase complex subunit slx8 [Aspergillus brasiliensis]